MLFAAAFLLPGIRIFKYADANPFIRESGMNPFNKRLVISFVLFCLAASPLLAESQAETTLSFEPGSGEKQFGVSVGQEGPNIGPMSVLTSGEGVVVLDAIHHRLIRLDGRGTFNGTIPLPAGQYRDITRSGNGGIWLVEANSRSVMRVAGGGIRRVFDVPRQEGFPRQLDYLLITRKHLVIMDYSDNHLYFFTPAGTVERRVEVSAALGFALDQNNRICFLGLTQGGDSELDLYNRLVRIAEDGSCEEKVLSGPSFEGARLLGFSQTGKPVVLGIASQDPFKRELFLVNADGTHELIDTITQRLLFATRYGHCSGNTLWVNISPMSGRKILFRRYELK